MTHCTWGCSHCHIGATPLVWTGEPDYAAYKGSYRICEFPYCTHPDAPKEPLPPCCHDAREGHPITWGAPCSKDGQEVLF